MSEEVTLLGSIIVPAIVAIAVTLLISSFSYLWHRRVNTPNVQPLTWGLVSLAPQIKSLNDFSGWIVLSIENRKAKAFKWFIERFVIAENVKGVIKVYAKNVLIYSQTLTWGLPHRNPQELSLNVGEIQRLDLFVKTEKGWHITAGRQSLEEDPLLTPPLPEKHLTIEIIITGKNFLPIVKQFEWNFPIDIFQKAYQRESF